MSELKICRICLRTEVKVYKLQQFHLQSYYEGILSVKVTTPDELPQCFCYECAMKLHNFHKFKEKCIAGQNVLREILGQGPITYESIKKLDREALHLQSPLELQDFASLTEIFSTPPSIMVKVENIPNKITKSETIEIKEDKPFIGYNLDIEHDPVDIERDSSPLQSFIDDNESVKLELEVQEIKHKDDAEPMQVLDTIDDKIHVFQIEVEPDDEDEKDDKSKVGKRKKPPRKGENIEVDSVDEGEKGIKRKRASRKGINYRIRHRIKEIMSNKQWKRYELSEDEAMQKFQERAKDEKYIYAKYKCTTCFRGFSKEEMLTRHNILRHSESLGPIECHFCRMRFKAKCYLSKHARQHYERFECLRCHLVCSLESSVMIHDDFHSGFMRKCEFCGEEFRNSVIVHDEAHSGFMRKCMYCNEEFRHSSTYYTHLRTHRSDYLCSVCGSSFVSQMGLSQHRKLKHCINDIGSADEDDNTYCSACDIRFETVKAYGEHFFHSANHSVETETELEIAARKKVLSKRLKSELSNADKTAEEKNNIKPTGNTRKHRRKGYTKRQTKPTTCHQCGKHFKTQSACMKHHLAEHPRTSFCPPTERHICEICGVSLAPGSVLNHKNIHTKEKIMECDTCGRRFTSSISLKRHFLIHTGEKPFPCTLCDKRFTQSNSMKLHYRTFHLKQPYPKRNRRKKNDEFISLTHLESGEDSGSVSDKTKSKKPLQIQMDPAVAQTMSAADNDMDYLNLGY